MISSGDFLRQKLAKLMGVKQLQGLAIGLRVTRFECPILA